MGITVIGLLGLPGAGKTTGGNAISEVFNTEVYVMGDVIRKSFDDIQSEGVNSLPKEVEQSIQEQDAVEDVIPIGSDSETIGNWVTQMLDIYPTVFAKTAVEEIKEEYDEDDVIVVDGIRTVADTNEFNSSFDNFELIHIYTPFSVRADRIISRGREGEENFCLEDVVERDERELGWGVDDILLQQETTTFYNNYETKDEFEDRFITFVEDEIGL